jgi:RNA polymerase sigma-70 factor (TIGR02943 family)
MQLHTLNCDIWVDNYADYLYTLAFYKVGRKEEAEDLVQETFLSAYKNKDTFNGIASEKTWLISILRNKITDYYRKPKLTDSFSSYLDKTEESFEGSFFDNDNYGRWQEIIGENFFSRASDDYLLGKEFQKFLSICLEKMPTKLRSIFISKYIDEDKTENICKEHMITTSNYWVIIFRSKTLLRSCLEKKGILS